MILQTIFSTRKEKKQPLIMTVLIPKYSADFTRTRGGQLTKWVLLCP